MFLCIFVPHPFASFTGERMGTTILKRTRLRSHTLGGSGFIIVAGNSFTALAEHHAKPTNGARNSIRELLFSYLKRSYKQRSSCQAGKRGYKHSLRPLLSRRFRLGHALQSNLLLFNGIVTLGLVSTASSADIDLS